MEGLRRNDSAVARVRAEMDAFQNRYRRDVHDCNAFVMPCACGYEEKYDRALDRITELENHLATATVRISALESLVEDVTANNSSPKH